MSPTDELTSSFMSWVARQSALGKLGHMVDDTHVVFGHGENMAHVVLLPGDDRGPMVVLRMGHMGACEASFHTRFLLHDRWHGRELVREMLRGFEAELRRGITSILVCCSTPEELAFVDSMQQMSDELPVRYEFISVRVEDALNDTSHYAAVMLMPSVSCRQREIHAAHPHSATFDIPRYAIANDDVWMVSRLLLEAMGEVDPSFTHIDDATLLRPLPRQGRVLILNIMYRDRNVRMGYRVYEDKDIIERGAIVKGRLTLRDIDDLLGTLQVCGIRTDSLEAIGIVVPGVVNYCSMNLPTMGVRDDDLRENLQSTYHIPVFIDNNTNAAAMGCYMTDAEHESLTLYRHQLGHKNGGQGTVIHGRLVTGRYNLAGEPKFYQRRFTYHNNSGTYSEAVWSAKGLNEIAKNVLLASIGTISPDVIYLAVNTIVDTSELCMSLEHALPKYCIPEIRSIGNYRERMYLGEVTLCLQRTCQKTS